MDMLVIKNQTNIQLQPLIMGNSNQPLMDKKIRLAILFLKENLKIKRVEGQILNLPGQEKIQLIGKYLEKEAEVKVIEEKDLQNSLLVGIK